MATFLKSVVLLFICLYQKGISPIKPPACRFYPTCSQYFYDAVQRYGVLKGLLLGFKRLLRCHPFNPGGYNPVE